VPPRSTLLAYTDGLIERRDESLEIGLERLRRAATNPAHDLETLIGHVLTELTPNGSSDDTAILGFQWKT
jgi:hypothetical protein